MRAKSVHHHTAGQRHADDKLPAVALFILERMLFAFLGLSRDWQIMGKPIGIFTVAHTFNRFIRAT